MESKAASKSAAIRARLTHPIIDSDGHQVEPGPIFLDYLKEVGGPSVVERFKHATYDSSYNPGWRELSPLERHDQRAIRPTWWAVPARNTRDLATALLPKLFYERMDEMGLDVSVVYPTASLLGVQISDEEVRRAAARAINKLKVDMFAG
jgi:hypothetical protein